MKDYSSLWPSVRRVAELVRGTQLWSDFHKGVPDYGASPTALQHWVAAVLATASMPRFGRGLFRMDAAIREFEITGMVFGEVVSPELTIEAAGWAASVRDLEKVVEQTIAWIRSRLPLYPLIPAPQLARGGHYDPKFPCATVEWRREDRSSGLQFVDAGTLDFARYVNGGSAEWLSAMNELLSALESTTEWAEYEEVARRLDSGLRRDLVAVRSSIETEIDKWEQSPYASDLITERAAQLSRIVNDSVDRLDGSMAAFANAFEMVNQLIDRCVCDILSCLLWFGPVQITGAAKVTVNDPEPGWMTVRAPFRSPELLHPPFLFSVELGNRDVTALCTSAQLSFDVEQANESQVVLRGQILPGWYATFLIFSAWPLVFLHLLNLGSRQLFPIHVRPDVVWLAEPHDVGPCAWCVSDVSPALG